MITILWAALAMVIQDVLGTLLVQSEARNRAHLSAIFDTLGWLASITTLDISVTALQGHDFGKKAAVLIAVSVANYAGSYFGVVIGKRFISTKVTIADHAPPGMRRLMSARTEARRKDKE